MFVAMRDIGFARGRFLLIGSVVALVTLLVGFLTGLTAGLGNQNISSVMKMKADTVVFSQPVSGERLDWSTSEITPEILAQWRNHPDVESASPLGIKRAGASGDRDASVILFGVEASSTVAGEAPSGNGMVRLSRNASNDLSAKSGDMVSIGKKKYTVEQVTEELWYEHSPVVLMTVSDLKSYSDSVGKEENFANVLLVNKKNADADFSDINKEAGTISKSKLESYTALSTFKSEIGSLVLMISMLFGISALIIGAFFTVWTIQRKPDIAVLKALGVSTSALIRDSLSQAFVVLFLGIATGMLATVALGTLASTELPFIISPVTLGIPAVMMMVTGLIGAALSCRSIVSTDPLTALNASH